MKRWYLFSFIMSYLTGGLVSQTSIHPINNSGKVSQGHFYRESGNLKYTLTNNEIVAIKLTDLQGKPIKAYLNYELKEKGNHEQNIKLPSDLTSGQYFLTISTLHGDKLTIKITR